MDHEMMTPLRIAAALERIADAVEATAKRFHEETKIGGALDVRYSGRPNAASTAGDDRRKGIIR